MFSDIPFAQDFFDNTKSFEFSENFKIISCISIKNSVELLIEIALHMWTDSIVLS